MKMKRLFDLISSFLALCCFLPLFLIIALLIKTNSVGPIFFSQKRIGKNFKQFNLYKFRSMVVDASQKGLFITASGDPRITEIGKFLRKTKMDELPQLFNVLKGDMSIVGPRPEVLKYVNMFRDAYKEILKIKPGITDFATIEFSDEERVLKKYSNPEEGYVKEILPRKIELYKKYIKQMSFLTDIKLILLTLWKIVKI
jgi:lipopolysaccharide/colanic/teichoic acid biosynthesis glycosyltransferase